MVDQSRASWNPVSAWLKRLEGLKIVACVNLAASGDEVATRLPINVEVQSREADPRARAGRGSAAARACQASAPPHPP